MHTPANIPFPARAFFHVSDMGKLGLVIRELSVCEAGDIEKAAQSVDDRTVSFHLIEDGHVTDASEDVAAEWMRINGDTVEFDAAGPRVPQFIINHAGDTLDALEGEIAASQHNNRPFSREHHYAA